ncbi:MAG TPA: hypothetical protein K8V78_11125 [Lacrimispora saccharolytica]|nr:hypothetical protein [Lacrimispora saccharolytica]
MWYVIQTETGKEEEILLFMRNMIPEELCQHCFLIWAEWPRRAGGQWNIVKKNMFPGYIFAETEEPEELFQRLKKVPGLTKLLGGDRCEFIPLGAEEERFFCMIGEKEGNCTGENRAAKCGEGTDKRKRYCLSVRPSTVRVDEEGKLEILNGALQSFKEEIVRVNLHKRYAVVRVKMLGEKTVLFGLTMEKDGLRQQAGEES